LKTFEGRVHRRDEIDAHMAEWIAQRTQAEVIDAFTKAEAAIGPVYSMADIAVDPHFAARKSIVEVDGIPMQGLVAQLSATPGSVRWTGRPMDADRAEILDELRRMQP
jgi:crotonobetainyl-CoA:carnitine CoA-transferase CaiB-like acyl-CoA transferase